MKALAHAKMAQSTVRMNYASDGEKSVLSTELLALVHRSHRQNEHVRQRKEALALQALVANTHNLPIVTHIRRGTAYGAHDLHIKKARALPMTTSY
jgi:hypothetical protein